MIDKIYILNISSETERLRLCTEKLRDIGTPAEKIAVFEASTADRFEKTRELCEAAAAEFVFFQKLLDREHHNLCYIGYLAQAWSYLRFYRHVQKTGETAVLLHDDQRFRCSFSDLQKAVAMLPSSFLFATLSACAVPGTHQWLPGTPWYRGFIELDSPNDFGILYNSNKIDMIFDCVEDDVRRIQTGWLAQALWNNIEDKDVYALSINPIPENLGRLDKIIRSMHKKGYEPEYMALWGIDGLGYDSALHNMETGIPMRTIESTKD